MRYRVVLYFDLRLRLRVERVPKRVRPFYGVYLVCYVFAVLNVLLLRSTRPNSESQSQGDSHECSVLHCFPLRERGRVAESPSVILGCSRRDSRVGEDLARLGERITPAWPVGSVAWRVVGMLSYLAFSLAARAEL